MKTTFLLLLFLLFTFSLSTTIINIPADQPTIQAGIDAAVDADTVLVQPGTYMENINYNGKLITVASLFLTTQDTTYISQTIIDGNSLDTVVTLSSDEDTTAVLSGFTITNGSDTYSGGIYCYESSPSLVNVTLTGNTGNGISCSNSNPNLTNVTITGNTGNGISCSNSSPNLENVTITDNSVRGIYCSESSPSLQNVTITANYGGGVYCYYNSSPSLMNVTITSNNDHGIICIDSSPNLENVTITGNNSAGNGGGICCYNSSPSLLNVTISGNSANFGMWGRSGGGIYCSDSSISFENVTISGNSANYGGGIYSEYSNLSFSIDNRCSIYSNTIENTRGFGADIYTEECDVIDIIVDTFTVMTPTDYYASPINNFTFDILHSIVDDLIYADVYVAVDGDDSNSGISPDLPFKTINHALSRIYFDSLNINTIHIAPGIYSNLTNGEIFPIYWSNFVNLSGSSEDETILDADSTSGVMDFYEVTDATISNITITNGYALNGGGIYCVSSSPTLQNITIINNTALFSSYYYGGKGGGIYCGNNSSPSLMDVTISDNTGHGIYCINSSPSLQNVTITGNYTEFIDQRVNGGGGGICCSNSSPSLQNVTITGNSADLRGGGIYCGDNSSPSLANVTITGNSASSGGGISYYESSPSFDPVDRCNIFLNFAGSLGRDLYAYDCPIIDVILDTFTVLQPDDYFTYPIDNFTFDILNANVEQVDQDLYVSPDGSDENSGLTVNDPLLTVSYALVKIFPASTDPLTIHLSNGTYSSSGTGEIFPLYSRSYVSLLGIDEAFTILDGEELSNILFCGNGNNFSIGNITIQNGGNVSGGGGIYCSNSSPYLENVTLRDNFADLSGGGMSCFGSSPSLMNVTISGNSASSGGGIYFGGGSLSLVDVTITDNSAFGTNYSSGGGGIRFGNSNSNLVNVIISGNSAESMGGGILFGSGSSSLVNVTITGNSAESMGGGLSCYINSNPSLTNVTISDNFANTGGGIWCGGNSNPSFDSIDRCNVFLNFAGLGCDLYAYDCPTIDVIVDTFTVLQPDDYFACPIDNFTFDILNAKVEQVDQDLYVSPGGSDYNSGLTVDDPLLTISYALAKILPNSTNPLTIHLSNGTYSPSGTGEIFPINCISYVSLFGEDEVSTILDGEGLSRIIFCNNDNNFSIKNITIQNGGNANLGGGIYCNSSSPSLMNVTISDNTANKGGGIYCYNNSNPHLVNVIIRDNSAGEYGGGIYCYDNSSPHLMNVTITGNIAVDLCGGICCSWYSISSLINCIMWNNTPQEIWGSASVSYSDIHGGWEGTGNIDEDPLFAGTGDHPFMLQDLSPCVNTGTPDTTGLNLPEFDLAGNTRVFGGRIDMGAYENQNVVVANEDLIPLVTKLNQNYPNPFNPTTTISFQLSEDEDLSKVELLIYNLKGQKIKTLPFSPSQFPSVSITWNGTDDNNKSVSSGIYFYKLKAGTYEKTKRMVLIK